MKISLKNSIACFFVFFVLSSCSSGMFDGRDRKETIQLADPTIFHHDEMYYLYGTGGNLYPKGFVVYASRDLKRWKGPIGSADGYALAKGNAFGETRFWAPQVFSYHNKFYMAYAADEHIAIAESDHPLGPFRQSVLRPISDKEKQIDPFVLIDDDGKKYCYYVVVGDGANRIYAAEMNDDFSSLKENTATKCIEADSGWENMDNDKWPVTEGPTVVKRNGLYYLVYSANHFRSPDYSVGYAVSTHPLGPWKKYDGNPIINRSMTGYNGSGHGDLIKVGEADWMYVLHTHQSSDKVSPRKTGILKVKFTMDPQHGKERLEADGKTFRFLYLK